MSGRFRLHFAATIERIRLIRQARVGLTVLCERFTLRVASANGLHPGVGTRPRQADPGRLKIAQLQRIREVLDTLINGCPVRCPGQEPFEGATSSA